MTYDYATLDTLRAYPPAWRLLRSAHAPMEASFLHRAFVSANAREMAAAGLAEALKDELYELRQQQGDDAFPNSTLKYLNDWADSRNLVLSCFNKGHACHSQPDSGVSPMTQKHWSIKC